MKRTKTRMPTWKLIRRNLKLTSKSMHPNPLPESLILLPNKKKMMSLITRWKRIREVEIIPEEAEVEVMLHTEAVVREEKEVLIEAIVEAEAEGLKVVTTMTNIIIIKQKERKEKRPTSSKDKRNLNTENPEETLMERRNLTRPEESTTMRSPEVRRNSSIRKEVRRRLLARSSIRQMNRRKKRRKRNLLRRLSYIRVLI